MSTATEKLGRTTEVIGERVIVRTQYAGQALRVSLVQSRYDDPAGNWDYDWPTEDMVTAELVIMPGHRLVVADGGVRVEKLGDG